MGRNINWYKKIIKSSRLREGILKTLFFLPNRIMLKIQYRIKLGRKLNLKSPQRFTEKLQVYKCNYKNKKLHRCVDKYAVREYVKEKGLESNLVKIYGIYDKFKDIDFNTLPQKFVMKSTNGGGGNQVIIVKDKEKLDLKQLKKKTKQWTRKTNYRFGGREFAYHNIKGRILIEELLEDEVKPINDYKFFCFEGIPKYVVVDLDRFVNHKRNIYDIKWNHLFINTDKKYKDNQIEKPINFDEMLEISKKLSKGFPFVRVDLYNVHGKIYFEN